MDTRLYVSNVALKTTDDTLRHTFIRYGAVSRARVVLDRMTGLSRGFAYVDMSEGVEQAIEGLNGTVLDGNILTVQIAKPRNRITLDREGFDRGLRKPS